MPTKDELKLLKFFGLSESDKVVIRVRDPLCFDIIVTKENEEARMIPPIILTDPEFLQNTFTDIHPGSLICAYPNPWSRRDKAYRSSFARNLRHLVRGLEAFYKARAEKALKASDEAAFRTRLDYESSFFDNDRSD